jgi:5-hydroxyisourate hydrolase
MPGMSVHAMDVAWGVPASDMRVEVLCLVPARRLFADGRLSAAGVLDHPIARERLQPGAYEVIFHSGAYFAAAGMPQADPPFLGEVPFRFSIGALEQHYHLPMKITPWGFSLYRGG